MGAIGTRFSVVFYLIQDRMPLVKLLRAKVAIYERRVKDLGEELTNLGARAAEYFSEAVELREENEKLKDELATEMLANIQLQAKLDAKPAPVEPKIIKAATAADVRRIVEQTNALDEVNPDGIR